MENRDPRRNDEKPFGKPAVPSPSASIILVSPSNTILLTHRVRTSSAFPSAHVFPGGNLEPNDGILPASSTDPARHADSLAYRTGAIRELFEETGILLARAPNSSHLIEVSARDRLKGRKAIHNQKVPFNSWLAQQCPQGAELDTDGLIPFTHWVTPPNVPKRFTTQMYLYFVPVSEEGNASVDATSDESENTAAEWKTAREWIEMSRRGEVILFPPQFLLLYLTSRFLDGQDGKGGEKSSSAPEAGLMRADGPSTGGSSAQEAGLMRADGAGESTSSNSREEIEQRRAALKHFVETDSSPPWKDKYISPLALGGVTMSDGRTVLSLEKPGLELKDSGFGGETDMVVFVKFRKEGPRQVDVGWRKEVLEDAARRKREQSGKL